MQLEDEEHMDIVTEEPAAKEDYLPVPQDASVEPARKKTNIKSVITPSKLFQKQTSSTWTTTLISHPGCLGRFNQSFNESHWAAVKRVFRYLQGTKHLCLRYSRDADCKLNDYCDSSWASDPVDSRSTTEYIFGLQGAAVCWNSRRQSTVSLSSTEVEYLPLSAATQEALWLNKLAQELLIVEKDKSLLIYCTNKGAIDLSKNFKFSARTKPINVRHYFVKSSIEKKEIEDKFVPSRHMLADALIKATNHQKLVEFLDAIGLKMKAERR